MRALRLKGWKSDPVLEEVPVPEPGPGEVLVQVGAAGACHSDLHLMRDFDDGALPAGSVSGMTIRPNGESSIKTPTRAAH